MGHMVSIRKELATYGLVPKKKWGQHFLIDRNILNKVIRTAQVEKKDLVLEIGPGLGEMTLALARQARKVIAVEIDPKIGGDSQKEGGGLSECGGSQRGYSQDRFQPII